MTGIRRKHVLGIGGALLLLTGVALHAQIPTDALSLDRGLGPGEIDHGATAPEADLQAQVLAVFELSSGSTVTFLAVPEIGELGYSELVPVGAHSVLSHGGDLRALDVFLALAPLDVPVPRVLIDLDTRDGAEKLAVGRLLTDRLDEPVYVLVDELGIDDQSLRSQAGASHYCSSAAEFASDLCKAEAGHNCNVIGFCDSGLRSSLTRESKQGGWQKRQSSFGWTATCGTAVEVRQEWWINSAWDGHDPVLVPEGATYWVKWHGAQLYRRYIRTSLSSGSFRAYTNFHNDC